MFSKRVPRSLAPNALAQLRAARPRIPYDLTVSNPTLCGLPYLENLLGPLGRPEGLVYRTDPLGMQEAREAVAGEYARHGRPVDPRSVVLTASTSEAYSLLFKLLCDPGEGVAVPVPSYPLFEHLATLEGVRAIPYPLDSADDWQPDLHAVSDARAVILVHPNNPTGTYVDAHAATRVVSSCRRLEMALIVDEVFHDYPIPPAGAEASFVGTEGALTFTLGGLSKYLGLPQVKLAWTVVSGPAAQVDEALDRLSFIADHYLSVATPVQLALAHLFQGGEAIREGIRARCIENLRALEDAIRRVSSVSLLRPQGGWSTVLRFPDLVGEEALALELLEEDGVAVHPGYFFDFPEDGYLALSLLPPTPVFAEGVRLILDRIGRGVES